MIMYQWFWMPCTHSVIYFISSSGFHYSKGGFKNHETSRIYIKESFWGWIYNRFNLAQCSKEDMHGKGMI